MRQCPRWISLAAVVLLASGLQAATMTEQQVTRATETWLREGLTDNRPGAQITTMQPHVVDGRTVAYIAHLAGGGFCLCGADDVLLPVYLYAPQGEFDPDDQDLQGILSSLASRLAFVQQASASGGADWVKIRDDLSQRRQEWDELSAGLIVRRMAEDGGRDLPVMMKLPLNSMWHQRSPYDADCPALPGESPSAVGCVATAMAQIMYYWQWPTTGYSSHGTTFDFAFTDTWLSTPLAVDPGITGAFWEGRLQWTSMDGGYLQMNGAWDESCLIRARNDWPTAGFEAAINLLYSQLTPDFQGAHANFAGTSYNFHLMADEHTDPGQLGSDAVAQLCYHAGIAVDMNWGYFGSGALSSQAGPAYENYFRYDPDHVYGDLDTDLIIEEIRWLRPVQVRGESPAGGHAWVVSGYDDFTPYNPYFWMNMGWSTGIVGWFRFDSVPDGFVEDNAHITGIAPAGVVRFVGPVEEPGADGSPANPYGDFADALFEIPSNGTIIIRAGTSLTWDSGGVIDRPLMLRGEGVTISVGQ